MFKRILTPVLLVCALASTSYGADDDVFLDEGSADFDSMPAAVDEPVAEVKEPTPPNPDQSETEVPMLADDSADVVDTPVQAPVKAAPVKKAKKEKVAKVVKPAKRAKAVAAAGSFVTTTEACPMHRAPASTSETMLTLKPARKIWVEAAEEGWVKGFNKAGEPGYISRDCVK